MSKDDELAIITMYDEELNKDVEFVIIDAVENNGFKYLLVVENGVSDDDEAEANILKEISDEENEETVYALVEDDVEFESVVEVFQSKNDDYHMEIEE